MFCGVEKVLSWLELIRSFLRSFLHRRRAPALFFFSSRQFLCVFFFSFRTRFAEGERDRETERQRESFFFVKETFSSAREPSTRENKRRGERTLSRARAFFFSCTRTKTHTQHTTKTTSLGLKHARYFKSGKEETTTDERLSSSSSSSSSSSFFFL